MKRKQKSIARGVFATAIGNAKSDSKEEKKTESVTKQ